ncbi:hypothetical protein TWF718_004927 [Orbilia javanica]|uniref:Uncharacterized protein n=1 Tax=Orbilia javanica TaxID=47235 RepID=A0AAN8MY94_9PEZI
MEEAASVGIQPTRPTSGLLPITRRLSTMPLLRCLPPPVKDYIRKFGFDWLAIAWIGVIAAAIDMWMPEVGGRHRYFRIPSASFNDTGPTSTPSSDLPPHYVGASELDHPARTQIISFWLCAGLDVGVPALVVGLLNLICNNGSLEECARAILGVVNIIGISCFIQVIMKTMIGGFRPGFLELCRPRPGVQRHRGAGYDGTYFKSDICTGDHNMIAWG